MGAITNMFSSTAGAVGNVAGGAKDNATGLGQAGGQAAATQGAQSAYLDGMKAISQEQNANTMATAQMESESLMVQALAKKLVSGAKAIKDLIQ